MKYDLNKRSIVVLERSHEKNGKEFQANVLKIASEQEHEIPKTKAELVETRLTGRMNENLEDES
jgi:hypothetical protein